MLVSLGCVLVRVRVGCALVGCALVGCALVSVGCVLVSVGCGLWVGRYP